MDYEGYARICTHPGGIYSWRAAPVTTYLGLDGGPGNQSLEVFGNLGYFALSGVPRRLGCVGGGSRGAGRNACTGFGTEHAIASNPWITNGCVDGDAALEGVVEEWEIHGPFRVTGCEL